MCIRDSISTAATAPETPDRAFEILYIIVLITVGVVGSDPPRTCTVSYTHLDVYKRQH